MTTRRSSWDDDKRKSPASPHSLTWPCNCGPRPHLRGGQSLLCCPARSSPGVDSVCFYLLCSAYNGFSHHVRHSVHRAGCPTGTSVLPQENKYKQNNPKQNKKILVEKIMLQLNWNAFVLMISLLFCGVLIFSLPAAIRGGALRTPPSPWKKPWEVREVLATDCATAGERNLLWKAYLVH